MSEKIREITPEIQDIFAGRTVREPKGWHSKDIPPVKKTGSDEAEISDSDKEGEGSPSSNDTSASTTSIT